MGVTTDSDERPPPPTLSIRQAAFIGVGAMVGAGIFALLGSAGEVAGSAVWISFLIAGAVAGLQGYSFAKFGARYPSAGGLLEYVARGFGNGHTTGVTAWLILAANAIVTGMVAVSFGSYASTAFADGDEGWVPVFAVLAVVVMTLLNILGSQAVARAQTVVVIVVLTILTVFAVSTLANADADLLAFSGYPPLRDIVSSVALTFFAFLGFGVITFTAKDLRDPGRELPWAIYLALGMATVIYVAVSLGVFGTLTVDEVVDSDGSGGRCRAGPRPGRLLAHDGHRAVRHRRGDQRRPVPGRGPVRGDGGQGPVPLRPRPSLAGTGPGGAAADSSNRHRARGRLRPHGDRLDRQRHRTVRLRHDRHRPPPRPA
jgi:amino acid transporter